MILNILHIDDFLTETIPMTYHAKVESHQWNNAKTKYMETMLEQQCHFAIH